MNEDRYCAGGLMPGGASYAVVHEGEFVIPKTKTKTTPAPGQASPDELSTGWTDESDGDN